MSNKDAEEWIAEAWQWLAREHKKRGGAVGNIRDLEDRSANGIWEAYFRGWIGATRHERAIEESQKLIESDKGNYVFRGYLIGNVPFWESPEGGFYKYDAQGELVPWQS